MPQIDRGTPDSRLFPAVRRSGVMGQRDPCIIDKNVYLRTIANKSLRKCRYGLKTGEVDECKLSIIETGVSYGLSMSKLEAETAW